MMIEGFGIRPRIIDCTEVVSEEYTSESGDFGYCIVHTVEYNCGRIEQSIYPDIRRNLENGLKLSLEDEHYLEAAKIRDHLKTLNSYKYEE